MKDFFTKENYAQVLLIIVILFLACLIGLLMNNSKYFSNITLLKREKNFKNSIGNPNAQQNGGNYNVKGVFNIKEGLSSPEGCFVENIDDNPILKEKKSENQQHEDIKEGFFGGLFESGSSSSQPKSEREIPDYSKMSNDLSPSEISKTNIDNKEDKKEKLKDMMEQVKKMENKINANKEMGVKEGAEKTSGMNLVAQKQMSAPPIMMNSNVQNGGFRFLPSDKCNKEYPKYTGASISGNMMLCGNEQVKDARLTPIINEGQIISVEILDGGDGYKKAPKIEVKGQGKSAKLKAQVDNGKITKVEVEDGGKDFYSTPELIVEPVFESNTCYLCTK